MQHRQRQVREARGDAGLQLRGQVDFGNQHQHLGLGVAFQHRLHRMQVDLGLAAAGYPVQQERRKALGLGNGLHRGALLVVQRRRGRRRLRGVGQQQGARGAAGLDPAGGLPFGQARRCRRAQHAGVGQRQRLGRGGALGQRLRQGTHATCAWRHGSQQGLCMPGQQAVFVGAGTLGQAWPALGLTQGRRQGRQHHFAQAALVVARGKGGQLDPVGLQRRHPVQALRHRAQPVGGHIGVVGVRHCHANHAAAAERHHHQVARGDLGRGEIVEAVVGGGVQRDPDDRLGGGGRHHGAHRRAVIDQWERAANWRHAALPGAPPLRNLCATGGRRNEGGILVCGATST
ncbi:hypothetical protein D9M72_251980 [compost metagenome]